MLKIRFIWCLALVFINQSIFAQGAKLNKVVVNKAAVEVQRPKMVIGIVVDQMRWDYLYRFYARYSEGGFKRLLREGFSAENLLIPYTPTYTACGHASIYTGSVPAINGIISNNWFDPQQNKAVYCVDDYEVNTLGSNNKNGQRSPKNLLVTTLTDELRMATNFRSKVISIAMKDRGAILPGGHTANGSFWYDGNSGNFISSTHYMKQLPDWVMAFNNQKLADYYLAKDWHTLYPIASYTESTPDAQPYERLLKGEKSSSFPHVFSQFVGKDYYKLFSSPYGTSFTFDFARAAINNEKLGQNGNTDFLALSISSTDYTGHEYGPNSIEVEDTYLRLDKELESFLIYLDKTYGKANYTLFLTADHGATHVPQFSIEHKMPAGVLATKDFKKGLDSLLLKDYALTGALSSLVNNQLIFNKKIIKAANVDYKAVKKSCIDYLLTQKGVLNAVDLEKLADATLPNEIKDKITKGYNAKRSGQVYFIFDSGWYPTLSGGTGHGAWNPYDSHIPALFMGWGIKPGKTNKSYSMTDIAPTIAALLHIQEPSGNIGKVITELIK